MTTQIRAIMSAWPRVMRTIAALGLGLLSVRAQASDVTQKDIQIIGRTLGFMEDVGPSPIDLGIVYLRHGAESVRQAANMQALLTDAPVIGKITLRPHLVEADDLADLDHAGALFIVPAAGEASARAALAGRRLHVPVLSNDEACAEAGDCVLSFSLLPKVEIFFNRTSADAAGVKFTPAFGMLVTKIRARP